MESEGKPIFLTFDRSIKRGGKLAKADEDIRESIVKGEGLITIESKEQLEEMIKAAGETFEEFRKLCKSMNKRRARIVRHLRVDKNYSWRAVAGACYNFGWGKWLPPSNQLMGMALCERAAQLFNENYMEAPWN